MAAWSDTSTTGGFGKKPPKRMGGMAEALSIASDLGFTIPAVQEHGQSRPNSSANDKNDDLIKILSELTSVQRNIATLQVELQGRKDDKNVAHLTHVREMEKKIESLARMTTILKDVIRNKDWIIARLQKPYSLDFIPVEAEYQKQFSELLLEAASDYGVLTASLADLQWSQNFKESPSMWGETTSSKCICLNLTIGAEPIFSVIHLYTKDISPVFKMVWSPSKNVMLVLKEMLRPIPAALASCNRFFEAMTAMRESLETLQQLRIGHTSLSAASNVSTMGDSKFLPPLATAGERGDELR